MVPEGDLYARRHPLSRMAHGRRVGAVLHSQVLGPVCRSDRLLRDLFLLHPGVREPAADRHGSRFRPRLSPGRGALYAFAMEICTPAMFALGLYREVADTVVFDVDRALYLGLVLFIVFGVLRFAMYSKPRQDPRASSGPARVALRPAGPCRWAVAPGSSSHSSSCCSLAVMMRRSCETSSTT